MGLEAAPGSVRLHVVDGVSLLHPAEQMLGAMFEGWRAQQLARNLSMGTVEARLAIVRAFAAHAETHPWEWHPRMVDEWLGDLRAVRGLTGSTIRGKASAVRAFCSFITNPLYEWAGECERRFGAAPTQVCHEWNTAVHAQEAEGEPRRRAFTIVRRTSAASCRAASTCASAARRSCPL